MDFTLSQEQKAFQKTAREFAKKEMAPFAAEWDEKNLFPKSVIQKAAAQGFCGLYLKEDQGGMARSRLDMTIILEELAAVCPSTSAYISIHNMTAWMIDEFGSSSLREEFIPKMVKGEWLGSYCLTEPWSGSDAAGLKTTAVKKNGQWI